MIGRTAPLLAQIAKVFGANLRMARELTAANAKLAVFTGPRQRDAQGHFLPVRKPVDQILDALEVL